MTYTYILKSKNKDKFYIGSTNDLNCRIKEHNSGLSYYTKRHMPWKLVYKEEYDSIVDARKREKYFKSAAGRRFLEKNMNIPG